ncbi:hypothetical protein A6A04_19915 [Paramagnetospirillum marisnigri]|uniref:Uncharacterized protein n=1 Tax=Paramagnetospirillum marisnigri TaxID=1285242 RepID=A0A178ML48_9PROT|nr:hypothetical protein A6A04_19915 [Paramagnetospirillum marisnigri]
MSPYSLDDAKSALSGQIDVDDQQIGGGILPNGIESEAIAYATGAKSRRLQEVDKQLPKIGFILNDDDIPLRCQPNLQNDKQ